MIIIKIILFIILTILDSAHSKHDLNYTNGIKSESNESLNKYKLDSYLSEKSMKAIQDISKILKNDDSYKLITNKSLEELVYNALHNQSDDFDRTKVNQMIEKWIDANLRFLEHHL